MGYTVPIPLGDPPSLLELSARYCINNLGETLGSKLSMGLKEGVVLPEAVCQTLLDVADKESEGFENVVVPIFQDPSRTRISNLNLRSSIISTSGFTALLRHYPHNIDISNCASLNPDALKAINKHSANLHTLTIGNATQIFPELLPREDGAPHEPIINAPKLRMLSIHEYIGEGGFWRALLPTYAHLTHLDLSGCGEVEGLDFLNTAENLIWLNLYNVGVGDEGLRVVAKCKGLRHLDVSQSNESSSVFQYTRETLTNIVQSLPNLTSLDISGTNLAGRGVAESSENCDIPGLESRVGNPLEFLGLYGALHDASHRHHIPAKRIAGDKDETQILVACQQYLDRSELLEKILNDLFHLFRADKGTKIQLSLDLILEAMNRHLGEKHVQISGSASLFYIFKNSDKGSIDQLTKKKILSTLIAAMEIHKFDATMMRNGCLTICLFHVPQDVQLFQYEKLVRVLLDILGGSGLQEDFVERIAIYLLNSLACQVERPQKLLVGELGAINKMLELIRIRLGKNECDDVMEIAWSTMWNVTDETEQNCRLFLDGNGMDLFLQCLNAFQNKAELLRNMMGLLGNVAEVPSLRPRLMNKDFISVFYRLLDSTQDNIEVSYNAAGVLAHILSDGDKAWTITKPLRIEVMEKLSANVQRWDVTSQRNINYRSFEPILRLLSTDVPVCRLWSAWALANLTRVYPDKYCPLLVAENGLKLLLPLTSEPGGVGMYATMAIDNVALENAKSKEGGPGPMQMD